MEVYSVFRRKYHSGKSGRRRQAKFAGDNCPLIYALKGLDDLQVELTSIKLLVKGMAPILDVIELELKGKIDGIVPMPSSSKLAQILATRLARRLAVPVHDKVLKKSTNYQSFQRAQAIIKQKAVSYHTERDLIEEIKPLRRRPGEAFSFKRTRMKLRGYFDPLQLETDAVFPREPTRLLVVDDLVASGETLIAASRLLASIGPHEIKHCVTWFSPVRW